MTKYDKLLIVFILIISIFFIIKIGESTVNFENVYVKIYVEGELYKKYSLDKNFYKVINIETKNGKNTIEIKNNNIRMIESSCPRKYCINQGIINKPGQLIACLPNKIIVEIVSENDKKLDTVSY